MNKPIEKGCLADVVGGVLGDRSPNKGLVVEVLAYVGDDPAYGRIWRCKGEYVESYAAVTGATVRTPPRGDGTMDFAQDWLRRRPDALQAPEATTIDAPDEVTA